MGNSVFTKLVNGLDQIPESKQACLAALTFDVLNIFGRVTGYDEIRFYFEVSKTGFMSVICHLLGLQLQGRLNNEPLSLFFNCVCVLDLNILVQANLVINKLKVIKWTVLEQLVRSAAWRSIPWEAGGLGGWGGHDAWRDGALCLFREGCGFTGCCGLL